MTKLTKFKSNILEAIVIALILLVFTSPLIASAAVDSRKPGAFPIGMDTWYGSVFNTSAQHDEKLPNSRPLKASKTRFGNKISNHS